jgi:hypothetical protein
MLDLMPRSLRLMRTSDDSQKHSSEQSARSTKANDGVNNRPSHRALHFRLLFGDYAAIT